MFPKKSYTPNQDEKFQYIFKFLIANKINIIIKNSTIKTYLLLNTQDIKHSLISFHPPETSISTFLHLSPPLSTFLLLLPSFINSEKFINLILSRKSLFSLLANFSFSLTLYLFFIYFLEYVTKTSRI